MFGWFRRVASCASSANIARNRREDPWAGRMRLTTSSLYVPSAPRFLARNTSAMPPAPRRRMTSKSARRFGAARGCSSGIDFGQRMLPPLRNLRLGARLFAAQPIDRRQQNRTPLGDQPWILALQRHSKRVEDAAEELAVVPRDLDVECLGSRQRGHVRQRLAWMKLEPFQACPGPGQLIAREPAWGALDGQTVGLLGCNDRRVDVEHTVEIIREADVDRLRTRRSGRDARDLVLAERLIVAAQRMLPLKDFDCDLALTVRDR